MVSPSKGENKEPNAKGDSSSGHNVDLSPDSIGAALGPIERSRDAPGSVIFVGLLDDDDEQRIRLYQDYEFRTYIRIKKGDILHRERITNQANVEISMVWVNKNASIEIREVLSEEIQADLLSQALLQAESGQFTSASNVAATPTITTITPPLTAAVCTKVFCTNLTCGCTARHSLLCSLACSRHPLCPNPWTENWFCGSQQSS